MPMSNTKMTNEAIAAKSAALPKIPKELLDQFVSGPMMARPLIGSMQLEVEPAGLPGGGRAVCQSESSLATRLAWHPNGHSTHSAQLRARSAAHGTTARRSLTTGPEGSSTHS